MNSLLHACRPFQEADIADQRADPGFASPPKDKQKAQPGLQSIPEEGGEAGPSLPFVETATAKPAPAEQPSASTAEPEPHKDTPMPTRVRFEPERPLPAAMRSCTTPACKTIYGVKVDFQVTNTEDSIRNGLFNTCVRPQQEVQQHLMISSKFSTIPAYQPINGEDAAMDFTWHSSFVEEKYNSLNDKNKSNAQLMCLHYSVEDANLQLMVKHHSQLVLEYEAEACRLNEIRQGCIDDMARAKAAKTDLRQKAMTAIREARDACLDYEASAKRVQQCQQQFEAAEERLVHKRKEDFQRAEREQAKKAKNLSPWDGHEQARNVVEGGMIITKLDPKPRFWGTT